MSLADKQCLLILQKFANYIPLLKCALDQSEEPKMLKYCVMKQRKKMLEMSPEKIKCFICNKPYADMRLKQTFSLSRCSDEIIEAHFVCKNCY